MGSAQLELDKHNPVTYNGDYAVHSTAIGCEEDGNPPVLGTG